MKQPWLEENGLLEQRISGFRSRPQQIQLAQAIEDAIAHGPDLVAEAGTGTGKTLAYLVPAIESGKKIVISTGTKTLQDQLVYRDLPKLEKALGRHIDVHIMKGRSGYLCEHRFIQAIQHVHHAGAQETQALDRISRWKLHTQTGDRDEIRADPGMDTLWPALSATSDQCLGKKCAHYESCWVTLMRQRARASQIIVVNHYLYFSDVALRLNAPQSAGSLIPEHDVVIFDEAHELEDIACDTFGVVFSDARVNDLDHDILRAVTQAGVEHAFHPLRLELHDATKACFSHITTIVGKSYQPSLLASQAHEHARELSRTLRVIGDLLTSYDFPEAMNLANRSRILADACDFLWGTVDEPEAITETPFAFYGEISTHSKTLYAKPVDPTPYLKQAFASARSICVSATLAVGGTLDHFVASMGLNQPTTLCLDSPFDYAQHALLYVPSPMPSPKGSPDTFFQAACTEIEHLIEASGGGVLILCTSRSAVHQYAAYFESKLPGRLWVQQPQSSTTRLVEEFRAHGHGVLIATKALWKGVDVPGAALRCVVIDKLPFAAPSDPITEARISHIEQQGKSAFTDYQMPQAILELKQGLGRLIRTETDRGVMAVLDPRLLDSSYSKKFIRSLPPAKITRQRQDALDFLQSTRQSNE